MNVLQRLICCNKGTAAVEFAFIGLVLILGTVGTIEVGRALFLSNELAHAADRAARAVMLNFDIAESALTDAVRDQDLLTGLVPANLQVASTLTASNARFRNVELTYQFTPMVSNLTIGSVTLTATRMVAK
jgi:Flp pilus assembly protein TadG